MSRRCPHGGPLAGETILWLGACSSPTTARCENAAASNCSIGGLPAQTLSLRRPTVSKIGSSGSHPETGAGAAPLQAEGKTVHPHAPEHPRVGHGRQPNTSRNASRSTCASKRSPFDPGEPRGHGRTNRALPDAPTAASPTPSVAASRAPPSTPRDTSAPSAAHALVAPLPAAVRPSLVTAALRPRGRAPPSSACDARACQRHSRSQPESSRPSHP